MKLYNLGKVPWVDSQLIYHAMAKTGEEALILLSPASPYVCIGFHQDAAQEVDLEYCRRNSIPVFRREVGGGAVYLDGDQLFFQLVLRRDNPIIPKSKEAFYRKFLAPPISVYREIGIQAEFKPVNDIVVSTRKISGTGVGEIGDCVVFVGNLIMDFNYEMMCRVLQVPDEKYRDKVHKSLRDNLSTIRRELGEEKADQWTEERLNNMMAEAFQKITGPMEQARDLRPLGPVMEGLKARTMKDSWVHHRGRRIPGRELKIRGGANVVHRVHKALGGLMRGDFEIRDGRLVNVSLTGDFFCFPPDGIHRLEDVLEGRLIEEANDIIDKMYLRGEMETPGIDTGDWMRVLG
jgi:lipoate-protein ligase A